MANVISKINVFNEFYGSHLFLCSNKLHCDLTMTDRSHFSYGYVSRSHADCIGSAFNAKGAMQCPNCRKIEKGQWLYATGCRQLPEFNMDEFAHDEDLYDLSYSEMVIYLVDPLLRVFLCFGFCGFLFFSYSMTMVAC